MPSTAQKPLPGFPNPTMEITECPARLNVPSSGPQDIISGEHERSASGEPWSPQTGSHHTSEAAEHQDAGPEIQQDSESGERVDPEAKSAGKQPRLTEAAKNELDTGISALRSSIRRRAQKNARRQGLSFTDKPHIKEAWRPELQSKPNVHRRIGWVCGTVSGGTFSFIITLLDNTNPSSLWTFVPLLAVLAISLIAGWNSVQ